MLYIALQESSLQLVRFGGADKLWLGSDGNEQTKSYVAEGFSAAVR